MRLTAILAFFSLIVGAAVYLMISKPQPQKVPPPSVTVPTYSVPEGEKPTRIEPITPIMSAQGDLPPQISLPPNELQPGTLVEIQGVSGNPTGNYNTKQVWSNEAREKDPRFSGRNVRVAVLDTGGQVDHPWIRDRIKGTYNAINKSRDVRDVNGHGTHCISIVLQASPEADIYVIKVLGDNGSGSVVDIAHGIDYAVSEFKVDVISMSLGGPVSDQWMPPAIDRARESGVIVIAAAGNSGPGANTDGFPARYKGVVSCGATDENRNIARFSSRGQSLFAAVPGVNIEAAYPGNRKAVMSGTSMACPLLAGICAGWININQDVERCDRPQKWENDLRFACNNPNERNTSFGYGIPDCRKFVKDTQEPDEPEAPDTAIEITLSDLTPEKQKELRDKNIAKFELRIVPLYRDKPEKPLPTPPGNRHGLKLLRVANGYQEFQLPDGSVWKVQEGINIDTLQLPAQPFQSCPGGICPR